MEENLILEGLLSMVTELKEKQEAQVTPASREETLERLNAIEQALSELHSNPAVPEKDLQAIRSQLDEIRNRMQGQQKHIEDTKKIVLETYRCFKVMIDALGSCSCTLTVLSTDLQQGRFLDSSGIVPFFGGIGYLFRFCVPECPFGYTDAAVTGKRYKIPLPPDAGTGRRRNT